MKGEVKGSTERCGWGIHDGITCKDPSLPITEKVVQSGKGLSRSCEPASDSDASRTKCPSRKLIVHLPYWDYGATWHIWPPILGIKQGYGTAHGLNFRWGPSCDLNEAWPKVRQQALNKVHVGCLSLRLNIIQAMPSLGPKV